MSWNSIGANDGQTFVLFGDELAGGSENQRVDRRGETTSREAVAKRSSGWLRRRFGSIQAVRSIRVWKETLNGLLGMRRQTASAVALATNLALAQGQKGGPLRSSSAHEYTKLRKVKPRVLKLPSLPFETKIIERYLR